MGGPADTTFRKPLSEKALRDVKADAVERLAKGAQRVGGEANLGNIERFVDPIVERIDRDHNKLLHKGIDPNTKPAKPADLDELENPDFERGAALGDFDFNKRTFTPNEKGAEVLNKRAAPANLSLNMRAIQYVVRQILLDPKFAEPWWRKLNEIAERPLPPGHRAASCDGCGAGARVCLVRETAYRMVCESWMKKFGDPRAALAASDRKRRKAALKRLGGRRG